MPCNPALAFPLLIAWLTDVDVGGESEIMRPFHANVATSRATREVATARDAVWNSVGATAPGK